ncbi:MAG: OmpA family protein [Moraxellaceae bacterium]|jgi:outer membrane protein OmpA-like peptidoglycan-associated protein|nr:MAG: OmpA family protein [Moraxellaceae bacterium]
MNIRFVFVLASLLSFVACSTSPTRPPGAAEVRAKLTALQSNPHYAGRAPVAVNEAEAAVRAAEQPRKKSEAALSAHLVEIANGRVDLAEAQAQTLYLEDERNNIKQDADRARLAARTQEADDLARQLADLNAKTTERGLVLTLGDVLFVSGQATLLPAAHANLAKLAGFLNQHPTRTVSIEGHTDSVGAEDYNQRLSQRRADAVRSYLMRNQISSGRLTSIGLGETSPVGDNSTATGRQSNRRVEVVIANPPSSS